MIKKIIKNIRNKFKKKQIKNGIAITEEGMKVYEDGKEVSCDSVDKEVDAKLINSGKCEILKTFNETMKFVQGMCAFVENNKEYIKNIEKIIGIKNNAAKHKVVKKQIKRLQKETVKDDKRKYLSRKDIDRRRIRNNKKVYEKEKRRKERERAKNEQNKNRS